MYKILWTGEQSTVPVCVYVCMAVFLLVSGLFLLLHHPANQKRIPVSECFSIWLEIRKQVKEQQRCLSHWSYPGVTNYSLTCDNFAFRGDHLHCIQRYLNSVSAGRLEQIAFMCLLCSNITSDTWWVADLSLQVSVDYKDFSCINGNERSAFQVLRQILNATSLDIVMAAAYSHLSALLINGSTLHAAVYLECCLLPCGGSIEALFCFHRSCAFRSWV